MNNQGKRNRAGEKKKPTQNICSEQKQLHLPKLAPDSTLETPGPKPLQLLQCMVASGEVCLGSLWGQQALSWWFLCLLQLGCSASPPESWAGPAWPLCCWTPHR